MGDKTRGLYEKFEVYRTDGEHLPGGKHEGCQYFVLDVTHDPFAIPALREYADSCRHEYPLLADSLYALLEDAEHRAITGSEPVDGRESS